MEAQRQGEDGRSSCAEAYGFRADRRLLAGVQRRVECGRGVDAGCARMGGGRRGEKEWPGRRWRII